MLARRVNPTGQLPYSFFYIPVNGTLFYMLPLHDLVYWEGFLVKEICPKNAVPPSRFFCSCFLTAGVVYPDDVIDIVEDDFRPLLVLLYHLIAQFVV